MTIWAERHHRLARSLTNRFLVFIPPDMELLGLENDQPDAHLCRRTNYFPFVVFYSKLLWRLSAVTHHVRPHRITSDHCFRRRELLSKRSATLGWRVACKKISVLVPSRSPEMHGTSRAWKWPTRCTLMLGNQVFPGCFFIHFLFEDCHQSHIMFDLIASPVNHYLCRWWFHVAATTLVSPTFQGFEPSICSEFENSHFPWINSLQNIPTMLHKNSSMGNQ